MDLNAFVNLGKGSESANDVFRTLAQEEKGNKRPAETVDNQQPLAQRARVIAGVDMSRLVDACQYNNAQFRYEIQQIGNGRILLPNPQTLQLQQTPLQFHPISYAAGAQQQQQQQPQQQPLCIAGGVLERLGYCLQDNSTDVQLVDMRKHALLNEVINLQTQNNPVNIIQNNLSFTSSPGCNQMQQETLQTVIDRVLSIDGVLMNILSFCDVVWLVDKKRVSRNWRQMCTAVIDAKTNGTPTVFEDREELETAVETYIRKDPAEMEELAATYGWPIGKWDVSEIDDFSRIFACEEDGSFFNEDISGWDVSNATDMSGMFHGARYFNQDLSAWNVSNVTCMIEMFHKAEAFNQDISSWDVSNVEEMNAMFFHAGCFDSPLAGWDTSNVTDMSFMFYGATSFNQDLSSWNTSNVADMSCMFNQALSFNQPLSTWDVSSVTRMTCMFSEALCFNQDVSRWNISSVTDMSSMFECAPSFDQDLSAWLISYGTNCEDMFMGAGEMEDHSRLPRQQDRPT